VPSSLSISRFAQAWTRSPFGAEDGEPWRATQQAERRIREAIAALDADYEVRDEVAVHRSATVEPGAVLKGPAIIGPGCLVAASAYLRGGNYLEQDCIIGPGCELKTSFIFARSKIAHLSFIGDSILGAGVNVEAGAMIANYRNECDDKRIRIAFEGDVIATGGEKFGALVGDGARIGANAVIAPGALIAPGTRIGRLELVDQAPR